jgi:hypothetical protein
MQAGSKQRLGAFTTRFAKVQNHGAFIRLHFEETVKEKHRDQQDHHKADNREAAAQCLRERLRTGIHGHFRRMRMPVIVVRMRMVVHRKLFRGQIRHGAFEQRERLGLLVKNQRRFFLERILQGIQPEQEAGQFGVLLKRG